jgi:glucokinase
MHGAGIDIGGTLTKVALVSPDGSIIKSNRIDTVAEVGAERTFQALRPVLERMSVEAGLPYPPPAGCGVGIPGTVDYRSGWLTESGPLRWKNVALRDVAEDILGCPVAVDTDANAGALADLHWGCAREAWDMIYVTWGTGIGAGLIFDRKPYHAHGGAVCNLGHAPADLRSTRTCYCGCQGCLEIEAGGRALVQEARERLRRGEQSILGEAGQEITPERIARAAEAGDGAAGEILNRAGMLMARVLAGVMPVLTPDTVVFGGGVSACFPLARAGFDREFEVRVPNWLRQSVRIAQSCFGGNAGVLGAATLVLKRPG